LPTWPEPQDRQFTTDEAVIAPWWSLALIPIGTVLVVVAATSLPARLATRIRTADALRYE
jgi:ABC-type lipoprotein release transport system permease subunit